MSLTGAFQPGAWERRKARRTSLNPSSASRLGRCPTPSITTGSGRLRWATISAVTAWSDHGSAEPVVIDGVGHLPNLEAKGEFNNVLRAFLRAHAPG